MKSSLLASDVERLAIEGREAAQRSRQQISVLEGRLEQESATVERLRGSVLVLENKLLLETTVSHQLPASARRIESSGESDEADLRAQVEDLQMELEDNRSEIDHLVSVRTRPI